MVDSSETLIRCPLCRASSLSRPELYHSSLRKPVRCESCGAEVRVAWWFRQAPHGIGGLIVLAGVASLMLASWIPLVAWFAALAAGHWVVWLYLQRFLVARPHRSLDE